MDQLDEKSRLQGEKSNAVATRMAGLMRKPPGKDKSIVKQTKVELGERLTLAFPEEEVSGDIPQSEVEIACKETKIGRTPNQTQYHG